MLYYKGTHGLEFHKTTAFLDLNDEMHQWLENHEPEPEEELEF
tara:strand:- start:2863 stop:2991 length:129 start_codon:yes stop_codon:yes gene_type:complete